MDFLEKYNLINGSYSVLDDMFKKKKGIFFKGK